MDRPVCDLAVSTKEIVDAHQACTIYSICVV